MKKLSMNQFRNGKTAIKGCLIAVLMLFNVITPGAVSDVINKDERYESFINGIRGGVETKLVDEVDKYIKSISPDSDLSPKYIVEKCFEYDFDITFVIAQALLESHFGTKGVAKRTNSVWNVGTYDNGQILYEYDNPNQSLEPYLKLVNEKYLTTITSEGKKIRKDFSELLSDDGYVNYKGKRFASSTDYESKLRKIIKSINSKSTISQYQNILSKSDSYLLSFYNSGTIDLMS